MLLLDDELFSCTPFLCICSFVLFVWRSALAGTRWVALVSAWASCIQIRKAL